MTIRASCRISVDKRESQSIDQQKHLVTRWAEYKHPGEGIEWYIDPGVSGGKPLTERPEGARLLKDLRQGDTLAVTKIDRMARNVRDFLDTLKHCQDIGATFVATEQDVSTEGAYGKFMLVLLGALAELERDIVSERTRAARAQFLRDGRYGVGLLPYGFHAIKDDEKGWLVVRPITTDGPCARCRDGDGEPVVHASEATGLRKAVLNVIAGKTQTSQAEALDLPEPTFRGLLTNPRLYGQTPGEGGKLDKDAGIISMSEWRQLQARIGGPRSWSRTDGYGKVLRCYHCKKRLYLDTYNNQYRCESKHPGRPTIRRSLADEHIESYFLWGYGDAPVIEVVMKDDSERLERLAETEIALENITARLRDDQSDFDALVEEVRRLKQQKRDIENEPVGDQVTWRQTGERHRDSWDRCTPEERVDLVAQVGHFELHPAGRKAEDGQPQGRIDFYEDIPPTEEENIYAFRPVREN